MPEVHAPPSHPLVVADRRRAQPVSHERFFAACDDARIDRDLADAAWQHVRDRNVALIGLSGKLASGKDTVAAGVYELLGLDVEHLYMAYPLKREVTQIISALREAQAGGMDVAAAAKMLADTFNIPAGFASKFAKLAADEDLVDVDGWTRTPLVRTLLQDHGTLVRRAQDPRYWIDRATRPTVEQLAQGHNVMFSDVRFPNEADELLRLGFTVVRLHVTPETQDRRLWERDRLVLTDEQRNAASEIALDDYENFTVEIDNNVDDLPPVLEAVAARSMR